MTDPSYYYTITNVGWDLIENGAVDSNNVGDFAMWIVVWVGYRSSRFNVNDLLKQADNIILRHFPYHPERTLKAAHHLKNHVHHTLMKALAKGWVLRI